MKVTELDYEIPFRLAAGEPLEVTGKSRDSSRLLVMRRRSQEIEHSRFYDLGKYLNAGDLLVLNNTRAMNSVLPGRIDTGAKIEAFLCTPQGDHTWNCQFIPSVTDVKVGQKVTFGNGELKAEVVGRHPEIGELWVIKFSPVDDFEGTANRIGRPVLSPYTKGIYGVDHYNTVYAAKPGSAETPSAGRHFTKELLQKLHDQGVKHVFVTLHTGLSSININEDKFEDHKMYEEPFEIDDQTASAINDVRDRGGRVVSVGTTVTRVLETVSSNNGKVTPSAGSTKLYIYPGYRWKIIDVLITNFHPPKSSRIALAASFTGKDLLMRGYQEAVAREYRFYEFGDSTLTI